MCVRVCMCVCVCVCMCAHMSLSQPCVPPLSLDGLLAQHVNHRASAPVFLQDFCPLTRHNTDSKFLAQSNPQQNSPPDAAMPLLASLAIPTPGPINSFYACVCVCEPINSFHACVCVCVCMYVCVCVCCMRTCM